MIQYTKDPRSVNRQYVFNATQIAIGVVLSSLCPCYNEDIKGLYAQFSEHMESVNDGIVTRLRDCPANELYLVTPKYLTPYLAYIKAHKRLFRTAVDHSAIFRMDEVYEWLFRHVFSPILERFQVPEQDRNYLMAFYMQGLMAVITQWMKQNCADSTDHIISVIQQCVMRHRENQEGS